MQRIFQGFNITSVFFVIGALVKSLTDAISKTDHDLLSFIKENPSIFWLSLFILIFKIKTFWDDHQHFGETHQVTTNVYRNLGFFLALLSWIFLGIGANFVNNPTRSSELIIVSLCISTAWIAIHLIEILLDKTNDRKAKEVLISLTREKWILTNIGYILLLGTFKGWLNPVIKTGNQISLYILIGLLIVDCITSRPSLITKSVDNQAKT